MTSVFVTFDGMTDRILHDALRTKGVTFDAARGSVEMYHGDISDHPDEVDAWFADLPWSGDDTAVLVAVGAGVMVTTVVVDGELASTTRADDAGVEVDDFLDDAA